MNRLIHLRLIVAITITTAIALGFFANRVNAAEATRTQPNSATVTIKEAIPVLPTIVVTAKAEIPMLPVVMVKPSIEERRQALATVSPMHASVISGSVSPLSQDLLPHMRLDMPYYSFGKMMPRAIKE